mgnify:CR=1 FL=1
MAEMMSTRETDSRILAVLILPLFSHPMFGYAAEARWGAQPHHKVGGEELPHHKVHWMSKQVLALAISFMVSLVLQRLSPCSWSHFHIGKIVAWCLLSSSSSRLKINNGMMRNTMLPTLQNANRKCHFRYGYGLATGILEKDGSFLMPSIDLSGWDRGWNQSGLCRIRRLCSLLPSQMSEVTGLIFLTAQECFAVRSISEGGYVLAVEQSSGTYY